MFGPWSNINPNSFTLRRLDCESGQGNGRQNDPQEYPILIFLIFRSAKMSVSFFSF